MKVSGDDVSNTGFPYMSCRVIENGHAKALAIRLTYLGELGWELHLPVERTAHVYQALAAAGRNFGMTDVGYRAIDTLRLEKRHLNWGADITPDDTPHEVGLGFCVAAAKGSLMGLDALAQIKAEGIRRQLVTFVVDAPVTDSSIDAGGITLKMAGAWP